MQLFKFLLLVVGASAAKLEGAPMGLMRSMNPQETKSMVHGAEEASIDHSAQALQVRAGDDEDEIDALPKEKAPTKKPAQRMDALAENQHETDKAYKLEDKREQASSSIWCPWAGAYDVVYSNGYQLTWTIESTGRVTSNANGDGVGHLVESADAKCPGQPCAKMTGMYSGAKEDYLTRSQTQLTIKHYFNDQGGYCCDAHATANQGTAAVCQAPWSHRDYDLIGKGYCRGAGGEDDYPEHYHKCSTSKSECQLQCNKDSKCTHMEWGSNRGFCNNAQFCVMWAPGKNSYDTPTGWTYVQAFPGAAGHAITQAGWGWKWGAGISCFAKGVIRNCICEHGDAVSNADCPQNGAHKCAACHRGYRYKDSKCEEVTLSECLAEKQCLDAVPQDRKNMGAVAFAQWTIDCLECKTGMDTQEEDCSNYRECIRANRSILPDKSVLLLKNINYVSLQSVTSLQEQDGSSLLDDAKACFDPSAAASIEELNDNCECLVKLHEKCDGDTTNIPEQRKCIKCAFHRDADVCASWKQNNPEPEGCEQWASMQDNTTEAGSLDESLVDKRSC